MAESQSVVELVAAAAGGQEWAWNALVDRYASLVFAVARRSGLGDGDVADVSQTVWLKLVEQLGALREPKALGAWLVTTTRREAGRVAVSTRRWKLTELTDGDVADDDERTAPDRRLLDAERDELLREAFTELPGHCRALLAMLVGDPPVAYAEISRRLTLPPGSIGPTRARCLDKLRHCPALASLLRDSESEGGGDGHGEHVVGRR